MDINIRKTGRNTGKTVIRFSCDSRPDEATVRSTNPNSPRHRHTPWVRTMPFNPRECNVTKLAQKLALVDDPDVVRGIWAHDPRRETVDVYLNRLQVLRDEEVRAWVGTAG